MWPGWLLRLEKESSFVKFIITFQKAFNLFNPFKMLSCICIGTYAEFFRITPPKFIYFLKKESLFTLSSLNRIIIVLTNIISINITHLTISMHCQELIFHFHIFKLIFPFRPVYQQQHKLGYHTLTQLINRSHTHPLIHTFTHSFTPANTHTLT